MSTRRTTSRMLRRRGRVHPLVITSLTALGLVALLYLAFGGDLPFRSRVTLHVLAPNSVAVQAGSPVRIAGVDVGSVESVSSAGALSDIAVALNGAPAVHSDATVRIRPRLVLEGSYYLDLDPGTPAAPVLENGQAIPASHTSAPVQLYQVLSGFDQATRQSTAKLIGALAHGLSPDAKLPESGINGLKLSLNQLAPTLRNVAEISLALRGTRPGQLAALVHNASQIADALSGFSPQLTDSIVSLNQVSGTLAARDASLAGSIDRLDQTLQLAPASLATVDRSLNPVARLSRAIDPSLAKLPPIITLLSASVTRLGRIVSAPERGQLLGGLSATFEQLPEAMTSLGTVLGQTTALTGCIRTHVTPSLLREVPDGRLSTGQPAWQDLVHFLPHAASAAANFDANGAWIRYLAAGGDRVASAGPLPGAGPLAGMTPGSSPILGTSPRWHGDLTVADFHPEEPCRLQPLPSLNP